jgi:hypothetical protein
VLSSVRSGFDSNELVMMTGRAETSNESTRERREDVDEEQLKSNLTPHSLTSQTWFGAGLVRPFREFPAVILYSGRVAWPERREDTCYNTKLAALEVNNAVTCKQCYARISFPHPLWLPPLL